MGQPAFMLWPYLRQVMGRSFRDFHVRTDIWYAAFSVAISGFTGEGQTPVAELTPNQIAWYVLVAVTLFALLRLTVLSPYRIWRDDQSLISGLKSEINSPGHFVSVRMAEHKVSSFKRISELVAEISLASRMVEAKNLAVSDAAKALRECLPLMEQFRYDSDFERLTTTFCDQAVLAINSQDNHNFLELNISSRELLVYLHSGVIISLTQPPQ